MTATWWRPVLAPLAPRLCFGGGMPFRRRVRGVSYYRTPLFLRTTAEMRIVLCFPPPRAVWRVGMGFRFYRRLPALVVSKEEGSTSERSELIMMVG